ncbi:MULTISPECIES: GldG family protein [Dyella]|uniref:ABC transporter n=2 Tax=Dyella TaxID=231454 RepID=A0A4R0Z2D3_9GAMM|nr:MULTISPECIES: GldG family protein [Dyella]TBR38801.1 ABC transporter [Dyella terrae]TCI13608.1 ABC transporter [Dyella soli]
MARFSLTRRTQLLAALALLVVVFIMLTLASSRWMRVGRFDLTSDHLYTLTPGTIQIVDKLHAPLKLTLYFSEHSTRDLPQLRSYEQRVREMLQEMVARSHGKLRLQVVDPVPYSDDEAAAEGNGLSPISGGTNGERVFFGLVGTTLSGGSDADNENDLHPGAKTLPIPLFDPARETFLEYDIAKLLYELNEPRKPMIGLISTLPVQGNPVIGEEPWTIIRQLGQLFEVKPLDASKLTVVPNDIQVLLLIHPKRLSDAAQYAIDQYVLRGGHLVVFVDPDAELDNTPFVDSAGVMDDHNSDLKRLFTTWGVLYDSQKVVLDRSRALRIELADNSATNHPAMLGLGGQELNHDDVITASLQRINLSSVGYFDLAQGTESRLVPLLQSTTDAEVVAAQRVRESTADPNALMDNYRADGLHYVIAARLRGAFPSAFPEKAGQPGHLTHAASNAEVILVADTDLLSDRLWVSYSQSLLGPLQLSALANNGDFVTNLADNLSGSSALLSIHGRTSSQRPFTRVQALQAAADQKFLAKKQELQRELAVTRSRLSELQPAKAARGEAISAEQRSEIEQFLQRQLAINKELRDVQHQLNAEIDALGMRLKFINIVLVPALITLFGLAYGWRRSRRSRRQA